MSTSRPTALTIADFEARIGTVIGTSGWHVIDQGRIDSFAEITGDNQHIHVDPEQARSGPFGGTIAHGFLTLSMLSVMSFEAVPPVEGASHSVNYGFDKIRFVAPVPSGVEISATFTLAAVEARGKGQHLFRYAAAIRARDAARPALHADWLVLQIMV
jgi:acyl dehydratase